MKGRKLLAFGLLSLFSFASCGKAIEDVAEPLDEGQGEQGQVIPIEDEVSPNEQSVYTMYKQINPSYSGDKAQFTKDLARGQIDTEEERISLQSVHTLPRNQFYAFMNALDGPGVNISSMISSGHQKMRMTNEAFMYSTFESTLDIYSTEVAVYQNQMDTYRITTSNGYKIKTGQTSYTEIDFMTESGLQCVYYYPEEVTLGDGYGPDTQWDMDDTPYDMSYFEYRFGGLLEMFSSPNIQFAFNAQGHLYGLYLRKDSSRLYDSYTGNPFYHFITNTEFAIFDFNTIEAPKLVSCHSMFLETDDHDFHGRAVEEPYFLTEYETVDYFVLDGETLEQLYDGKTRTDFIDMIPTFVTTGMNFKIKRDTYTMTGGVPDHISSEGTAQSYASDNGSYKKEELLDGSIKYSYIMPYSIAASTGIVFSDLALTGWGFEYDDSTHKYEEANGLSLNIASFEVELLEGDLEESNRILQIANIEGTDYVVIKDHTTKQVAILLEVTQSLDQLGVWQYDAKVQVINLAAYPEN